MKQGRLLLTVFLAVSLVLAPWLGARAQVAQDDVQLPAGFETMFDEIAKVMQKYPGATGRFSIRDRKATPIDLKPRASSHHFCCERHCTGPGRCTCVEWCPE